MIENPNIRAILTDIEGTTSSISFVKDVLFPYAREHMDEYVRSNEDDILDIMDQVRTEEHNPCLTCGDIIKTLIRWIDEDQKITPLKTLQGMIWKAGYESGELKGYVYPDTVPGLKRWKEAGMDLYVYSSGSIAAQKLLFAHTEEGDLTPLFSGYFDTTSGSKMEAESYSKIAEDIGLLPGEILFLSDALPELEAAKVAGMEVILLDRDGEADESTFKTAQNFDQIKIKEEIAA